MYSYNVELHDIHTLTAPMFDACGMECPKMIGAACPADSGNQYMDGPADAKHYSKRCPGWSAKFADAASEVIHGWTLDSRQDEEAGNACERDAWFALFKNDDVTALGGPMGAGVILCVTSSGYVQATRFKDTEELTRDWAKITAEYEDDACEECGNTIPATDADVTSDNEHHAPSCSLYREKAMVGLPELKPGEEPRPAFSDTHPRAARELGELIQKETD